MDGVCVPFVRGASSDPAGSARAAGFDRRGANWSRQLDAGVRLNVRWNDEHRVCWVEAEGAGAMGDTFRGVLADSGWHLEPRSEMAAGGARANVWCEGEVGGDFDVCIIVHGLDPAVDGLPSMTATVMRKPLVPPAD